MMPRGLTVCGSSVRLTFQISVTGKLTVYVGDFFAERLDLPTLELDIAKLFRDETQSTSKQGFGHLRRYVGIPFHNA